MLLQIHVDDDIMNNVKNILVDKIFYSAFKKHKMKSASKTDDADASDMTLFNKEDDSLYSVDPTMKPDFSTIKSKYQLSTTSGLIETIPTPTSSKSSTSKIEQFINERSPDDNNSILPWYRLLSLPQKQMIVIDRMHSGARRFVTLDFGTPILLTDVVS